MTTSRKLPLSYPRRLPLTLVPAMVTAVALLLPTSSHAGADDTGVRMRRFALMAGVNSGGPSRAELHFATSDAQAMAKVLETLGGVSREDLLLVHEPSRAAMLAAFDRLGKLVAAGAVPGGRREVVVYYSGHSDEEGLLIGGDRVSYDELRARIQAIPADVRLAILDSCASGAFTRHKGGVRRPPFLMDTSVNTKGHAFLTSSAINEVAQESNRIGASFFTHYLVSGLRGAADVNRDRRVTLQEAFQFAAQETLAHTEKTRGGPQHAAYEFDLVGTSDLVVTDVRSTQATLALGTDLSGRIGVRDSAGNLVVELRKTGGNTIELGLEAGTYLVTMEGGSNNFEAEVSLALGQRADLARLAFHPGRPLEAVAARGDAQPATGSDGKPAVAVAEQAAPPPLRSSWIHLGLVPMSGDGQWDIHGLSFGFIADRVGKLSSGLQLSLGASFIDRELDGTQITVGANILRGSANGLQLSVGFNYATGPLHGAQIVTGLNLVRGDARGAQIAAGANITGGRISGAQIAAGANIAGDNAHGAQIAAGFNHTIGRMSGAQVAAGVNIAGADSLGAQFAAGINVAAHAMRGAQIAGGVNFATTLDGAQIAPLNLAGTSNGTQLGVLNLALRGRGLNIGVVNLAREHDGETLGLLNLVGNGIHSVAAYATDSMLGNLELKLGSRHLYTSFLFASHPGDDLPAGPERFQYSSRRHAFGMGLGWRQPLERGRLRYLEVEATQLIVRSSFRSHGLGFSDDGDLPLLASLRVLVGIQIYAGLHAIAGISGNTTIAWNDRDLDLGAGFLQATQHSGKTTVREYPGLLLGLQM
jgi:hypothetical protein